jgi:uncharacterized LabA/DUF88 family protein
MIALFCDVSNLYYCVSQRFDGRKINYLKYLEKAQGEDILYKATAYSFKNPDCMKFLTSLKHIGFDTKSRKPSKIGWSVQMACDIFRMVQKIDKVVIGSSDPNLIPLIEFLKERSIKVHVLACGITNTMRQAADHWEEITSELLC